MRVSLNTIELSAYRCLNPLRKPSSCDEDHSAATKILDRLRTKVFRANFPRRARTSTCRAACSFVIGAKRLRSPRARFAIAWRNGLSEKFHRGGTSVGVHRAKQLAERRDVSLRDIIAISAYFARHEVDKASKSHEWAHETDPSAGYIAWLLWGGEPGRRWADSLTARLNKTAAE
jgi:hypothetical protein